MKYFFKNASKLAYQKYNNNFVLVIQIHKNLALLAISFPSQSEFVALPLLWETAGRSAIWLAIWQQ